MCLAGADGSHHLRSENPTWYHLKPFASLTSSFSFLYRVFLQAPFIDRFLSWPPLPVLGVLSHGRRQTVRRLGPPFFALLSPPPPPPWDFSRYSCGLNVSSPVSPFPPTPPEASANNLLNPPRANSFSKYHSPFLYTGSAFCELPRIGIPFRPKDTLLSILFGLALLTKRLIYTPSAP